MHERDGPTPTVKIDRECDQDNAGHCEAEDHASGERRRFFDASVEQEAEDPVRLKMGRDVKDKTDSDHQAVTEDEGNRQHVRRGKRSEAFSVECRKQGPRSDDHAYTKERARYKSVRLIP